MHHFDAKHYGLGLANAHDEAERRLAATEDLFDPMTFRLLDELELTAGARCLELGAGSGSVGRFLADQVEGSNVVVTDIDTTQIGAFVQGRFEFDNGIDLTFDIRGTTDRPTPRYRRSQAVDRARRRNFIVGMRAAIDGDGETAR